MALSDTETETLLSTGITAIDVVRLSWPDATDAQARYVLWEYTPYPLTEGLLDLIDAVGSARDRIGLDLPAVDDRYGVIGHRNGKVSAA